MTHLSKITTTLFLLIQSICFGQESSLVTISEKYNSLLKEQNKGIAMLIKKNNKTETLSLGNFNLNKNNVFNIGSATKTFTAILLLQEVEKGNLKLSDSIGTYLTPIQNVDGSLTIEALMTHESGLDEIIELNIHEIFYAKNDSIYNAPLLNEVEKNNPKTVGEFRYCNTNYYLLGKIIEKVTDQSYFDVLRERIFMPLKMESTYPYVHKNIPNLATPYDKDKDVTAFLDHRFYANTTYAGGCIASTLSDMEKFYTSLFETELLLKKETANNMMLSGNELYGLGISKLEFNGKKHYGHGGNNIGYAFRNAYNPKTKNLFLMFTNTFHMPLENTITSDIIAYLNDLEITAFSTLDNSKFKNFIGSFLLKEGNLVIDVIEENNNLYLEIKQQEFKSLLTSISKTTLKDVTVGVTLQRIEGDDNSLKFSQNGFDFVLKRVNTNTKK